MRTNTILNTTITYPDEIVWLHDNNVIKLVSNAAVGADVTVIDPAGRSHELSYYSEMSTLMFVLDEVLEMLYDGNLGTWTCKVKVYDVGFEVGGFGFTFKVLDGKSFITRSHGMSHTIYVYSDEDLYKLQIYSPASGQAVISNWGFNCYPGINQYNLQSVITSEGEYSFCLQSSSSVPSVVTVTNDTAVNPTTSIIDFSFVPGYDPNAKSGGDIWDESKDIFPVCHRIVYESHCEDYDFAELRYVDTDGCIRYLGGKVIEEIDEVEDNGFGRVTTDVWKKNPSRWSTSSNKVIKIYFEDIARTAYPGDIIYSSSIQLKTWDGEWREVRLKTNSITTTDEDFIDFEIEVYVHEI